MTQRLQKILAHAGLGSRREIEEWIKEGRVQLNGQTAELGAQASANDKIKVDGKLIKLEETEHQPCRVLLYNKPEGEICTRSDPEARKTVFARLPDLKAGRWISIGRLDINTSGLLLFTNDGELAHRLMHPSYQIEREYAVRILGEVTDNDLTKLHQGVQLDDGMAKFDKVVFAGGEGANQWYHVTLREGRSREVRRLWEALECTVSRLSRIRYATITLPRALRTGQQRELTGKEIQNLKKKVGLYA